MSKLLSTLLHYYMPGIVDGDGGGDTATVDRGDDFVPTGPDTPTPDTPAAPDAAAAEALEAELAEKEAAKVDPKADAGLKEAVKGESDPDEPKTKSKDSRIPASRHKEILDKERARREAVEAKLAQYEQGGKIADLGAEITAAEDSLVTLEAKYAQQLTDGETKEAAATMTQIRRTERAINERAAATREAVATARAVEQVRYDTTVERLETQFPMLNVDHEDFDAGKTGEVLELKEAYQMKGYTPSAALQKAVKLIMPPETKGQEKALETEARVDPKEVEKARKAAAVAKTADALGKTPASTTRVGANSDAAGGGAMTAADALKMPYNDFIKLDENTLAKMRGDVV